MDALERTLSSARENISSAQMVWNTGADFCESDTVEQGREERANDRCILDCVLEDAKGKTTLD